MKYGAGGERIRLGRHQPEEPEPRDHRRDHERGIAYDP
jgi:hypothetical protein